MASETENPADEPKTFFQSGRRSFKDVPIVNDEISTSEFLEACDSVVAIFDLLQNTALSAVKSDIAGNIKKVRDRQRSHPAESETLQALVKNEMAQKQEVASEGLLWLNRGLSFTLVALRRNISFDEKLATSFSSAYSVTLKKFHGIVVRGVLTVAMTGCPSKEFLYTQLSGGQTDKTKALKAVKKPLEEWLTGLDMCVVILNGWIEGLGLK